MPDAISACKNAEIYTIYVFIFENFSGANARFEAFVSSLHFLSYYFYHFARELTVAQIVEDADNKLLFC